MTQKLIIHITHTARVYFLESRASTALILTTIVILAIGGAIPYTPQDARLCAIAAALLGLRGGVMCTYAVLTHFVKMWLLRR